MTSPTENQNSYKVKSLEGAAAQTKVAVGQTVWAVGDEFGLARDDTRYTGVEYVAVSPDLNVDWYFTIPAANLEKLT